MTNKKTSEQFFSPGSSAQMAGEYDIVIVGAGSAGTLLANRLATSPKLSRLSILILETGSYRPNDPKINTPGFSRSLLDDPNYDWCFLSEQEPGLGGRRIKHPRGKVVGGTSAINSHSLVFPSRFYHDYWNETLLGTSKALSNSKVQNFQQDELSDYSPAESEEVHRQIDWSWEGVAGCYSKAFEVQPPDMELCRDLHLRYNPMLKQEPATALSVRKLNTTVTVVQATEGCNDLTRETSCKAPVNRIQASFPRTVHDLQKHWITTFENANFLSPSFGMDGQAFGGLTIVNAVDGRPKIGGRSHAGREFWEAIKQSHNVTIRENVLVEKIEFSDQKSEAGGRLTAGSVQFVCNGQKESITVKPSGEVILCAGVFGSPHVLELSGIGAKTSLTNAGVSCVYELPGVGENLQDHLNCGCSVELKDGVKSRDAEVHDVLLWKTLSEQFERDRTGALADGGAHSYAHVPTQWLSTGLEQDDLERTVTEDVDKLDDRFLSKGTRLQHQFIKTAIKHPKEVTATMLLQQRQRHPDLDVLPKSEPNIVPGNYLTVVTQLSYPFSRGSCHIVSKDPLVHSQLKFNYLSHPLDKALFRSHVKQVERFIQLPTLAELIKPNGRRLPRSFPRKFTEASNAELDEMLKSTVATNYHPCGTCAMMREDLGGVVDESFKVYGTANVRVVDASVIPIIPRGNILTTVYALAEKAADVLLDQYSSHLS